MCMCVFFYVIVNRNTHKYSLKRKSTQVVAHSFAFRKINKVRTIYLDRKPSAKRPIDIHNKSHASFIRYKLM